MCLVEQYSDNKVLAALIVNTKTGFLGALKSLTSTSSLPEKRNIFWEGTRLFRKGVVGPESYRRMENLVIPGNGNLNGALADSVL